MAGEMDSLFEKVFQNPLVLASIFRHFKLKGLLPFRQVSKTWKSAVDLILRETFTLFLDLEAVNWFEKLTSDLKYFGTLNLSHFEFYWSKEIRSNLFTAFHLKEYGKQIKVLKIHNLKVFDEADFATLELLLISMPILQRLYLQPAEICVDNFLEFNPIVSIDIVEIDAVVLKVEEDEVEAIVSQFLKIFGDLYSNFDDPVLDRYLINYLSKRREPMHSLRKMEFVKDSEINGQILYLLQTLEPRILPNLKSLYIYFGMPTEAFAISLKKCLENVCKNLEKLTLLCSSSSERRNNVILISLKPLSKLRILKLGIPPIIEGKPAFFWDLGKQLAKDFPNLEELILKNDWSGNGDEFDWKNYKYPEAYCIWEPFVPIIGTENVDLSPLKTVKRAKFCLPPDWLRNGEDVNWTKSFLEARDKLYPEIYECYKEDIILMLEIMEEQKNLTKG